MISRPKQPATNHASLLLNTPQQSVVSSRQYEYQIGSRYEDLSVSAVSYGFSIVLVYMLVHLRTAVVYSSTGVHAGFWTYKIEALLLVCKTYCCLLFSLLADD